MPRQTLALIFQEPLTAIARLWSGRNIPTDAGRFRGLIHQRITDSADDARRNGFSDEDTKLATFAVVGFVDETILNLNLAAFADWRRKPLGEEMFGVFLSGEIFFQNLEKILRRPDSHESADLMELYATCILLGFQGRLSGNRAELKLLTNNCLEKIRRIRGTLPALSPHGGLPTSDAVISLGDPWKKRLAIGAASCAALAILLFAGYKYSLYSGVSELQNMIANRLR